jgi:hypothetical protein
MANDAFTIERRRMPRKRADITVTVTDSIIEQPIGLLGNLSSAGMMLICPQPPCSEAIYQVSMTLPDGNNKSLSIDVGVQEQWHVPAASPGQTWAGYRIIAISDADHAALDAWLRRAD